MELFKVVEEEDRVIKLDEGETSYLASECCENDDDGLLLVSFILREGFVRNSYTISVLSSSLGRDKSFSSS